MCYLTSGNARQRKAKRSDVRCEEYKRSSYAPSHVRSYARGLSLDSLAVQRGSSSTVPHSRPADQQTTLSRRIYLIDPVLSRRIPSRLCLFTPYLCPRSVLSSEVFAHLTQHGSPGERTAGRNAPRHGDTGHGPRQRTRRPGPGRAAGHPHPGRKLCPAQAARRRDVDGSQVEDRGHGRREDPRRQTTASTAGQRKPQLCPRWLTMC